MSTLTTKQRDALPDSAFAGPYRTFPILDQDDVDSAAHLIGKAADPAAVKAKIVAKAKANGWRIPDAWRANEPPGPVPAGAHPLVRLPDLSQGPAVARAEGRSLHFLSRFYDELKAQLGDSVGISADQVRTAYRKARAAAGGKLRRRMAGDDGPDAEGDDDPDDGGPGEEEDGAPDGAMVAYFLDPDAQATLAQAGGEAAGDLHVTLCHLGDLDALDELARARALLAVERYCRYMRPLEGKVGGVGRFNPSEGSDGAYPIVGLVDVPGLEDCQDDLCDTLAACGVCVASDHGFQPHVTLRYDPDDKGRLPRLADVPICVDGLHVCFGAKRVYIPFGPVEEDAEGAEVYAEAAGTRRLAFALDSSIEPDAEWVHFIPGPGTYRHPAYGPIEITQARCATFVRNVKERVYQEAIPIDAEHNLKMSGAVGWIRDARLRAAGGVEVHVTWTDRGKRLLAEDGFRYVSPEWHEEWTDPATGATYADVICGGAICTRPFFKERSLEPLRRRAASEDLDAGKDRTMAEDKTAADAQTAQAVEVGTLVAPPLAMGEDLARRFAEQDTRIKQLTEQLTTVIAAGEQTTKALKEATDQLSASRTTERRRRFTEEVRGRSPENGNPWFGAVDDQVAVLEQMAAAFGEDSEIFKKHVEGQRAAAAQIKAGALFTEMGRSGAATTNDASPVGKVNALARQIAATDPKVTQAQAVTRVLTENPDLYAQYQEERRARLREL